MIDAENLAVFQIEPLHYSPDEFSMKVRNEVEKRGTKIVMIDSISGYKLSLKGEDLVSHLHSLCKYMANMGITVILINEIEHITGEFMISDIGISYLADNVVFLRYLEMNSEMHKVIGVLKKRLSNYEKSIREMEITEYGINVGKPLKKLRGILSGVPEFVKEDDGYG